MTTMDAAEQPDDGSSDILILESLSAVATMTVDEVEHWQREALTWAETDRLVVDA